MEQARNETKAGMTKERYKPQPSIWLNQQQGGSRFHKIHCRVIKYTVTNDVDGVGSGYDIYVASINWSKIVV